MHTTKSMRINGTYIEDLIEGYTTIAATGRASLIRDHEDSSSSAVDGIVIKNTRYPARTIEVTFYIEGDLDHTGDHTELINKCNILNGILSFENAKIQFDDEPTIYYTGTGLGITEVEYSLGVAAGSFQIICADPFKYSNDYITVEPNDDGRTFEIDYNGTYKSYPILDVKFNKTTNTLVELTEEEHEEAVNNYTYEGYSLLTDGADQETFDDRLAAWFTIAATPATTWSENAVYYMKRNNQYLQVGNIAEDDFATGYYTIVASEVQSYQSGTSYYIYNNELVDMEPAKAELDSYNTDYEEPGTPKELSYENCTSSTPYSNSIAYFTKQGNTYSQCEYPPSMDTYLANPTNYYIIDDILAQYRAPSSYSNSAVYYYNETIHNINTITNPTIVVDSPMQLAIDIPYFSRVSSCTVAWHTKNDSTLHWEQLIPGYTQTRYVGEYYTTSNEHDDGTVGTDLWYVAKSPSYSPLTSDIVIQYISVSYSTYDSTYKRVNDAPIVHRNIMLDELSTRPSCLPYYRLKLLSPSDISNAELESLFFNDASSCGYVGLLDTNKHVLQFGNPEAVAPSSISLTHQDVTLIDSSFKASTSFSAKVQDNWLLNTIQSGSTISDFCSGVKNDGYISMNLWRTQLYNYRTKTQTMLKNKAGDHAKYTLQCTKISNRTQSSAKFIFSVSATLTSALPDGGKLYASIYDGSNWHDKKLTIYKGRKSAGVKDWSITVDGFSATTQSIKFKFAVTRSGGEAKKKANKWKDKIGKLSTKTCSIISMPLYMAPPADGYYLTPASYQQSTGTRYETTYHGPSIIRTVPNPGANFEMTFTGKLNLGDGDNMSLQRGGMQVLIFTGDSINSNGVITNPKVLSGFDIFKNNDLAYPSTIRFRGYGKDSVLASDSNKSAFKLTYYREGNFTAKITKAGETIAISITNVYGKNKQKTITHKFTNIDNTKLPFKIYCGCYAYGASPVISYNGIRSVKLTSTRTKGEEQIIPFKVNDTLEADTSNGNIYYNGVLTPSLGALGNDWEDMALQPDVNSRVFTAIYSDWLKDVGNWVLCKNGDWAENATYYSVMQGQRSDDEEQSLYLYYEIVDVTESQFNANPSLYYRVSEHAVQFKMRYREVFI